ncbi:class I SAM-dependent methyltransferase [Actinomadura fibrosa]|uniref:Class I SAM-dependent methyltransferase n=1 Tax=Actinomadura fibrosa TaxID=111802 RepID=A0ABW2XVN3_9ACTN|nr:class I SAM-dependent methyltransferase [Actinomadura fibrosa]
MDDPRTPSTGAEPGDGDLVSWTTGVAAAGYEDRDMSIALQIAYPLVLRELGIVPHGPAVAGMLLDLGCGTGVLAELAAAAGVPVLAVDPSEHMLHRARRDRPHPLITYRRFDGERLTFVADGSVAAAAVCLVCCTVPDTAVLTALARELHRVLRPGGRLAVLELSPAGVGVRFSTLRFGDPGRSYENGELLPTFLRLHNGDVLRTACYFRSERFYRMLLAGAGFTDHMVRFPLVDQAAPHPGAALSRAWGAETTVAPYMILSARR